ncbi:MAG: acyl-CoA desaturase [Candidatus Obscuribacterales bacterium]|nr:acyl-CoA desaturase [Candidatus Obscuribacterales bacterium]
MIEFLCVFVISYVLHGMGMTIGYHRLLSHRSFTCPKPVEYFWVTLAYLGLQGSPMWWAAMHRAHHRHVDTELDPHSPKYGLFNSSIGWLMKTKYPDHIDPAVQCKDMYNDPYYRFLEQDGHIVRMNFLCLGLCIAFRLVLLALFGWQVALANLIGGLMIFTVPLMLNVVCHLPKLGYKNFATNDDGVNVWWVGLLALGEGWHNNHHAYPGAARNGMRLYEIDVSFATIRFMKAIGLVRWMNQGPDLERVLPQGKASRGLVPRRSFAHRRHVVMRKRKLKSLTRSEA